MDWIQPFSAVRVEGPVKVLFSRIGEGEQMRISYDTNANPDSRLKASVDKQGVLNICERGLRNSTDTTVMHVYYRTMESLEVDGARVRFDTPVEQLSFDAKFSGGAMVDLPIEMTDAVITLTGKSEVTLKGKCRYFDLELSTGKVNASALECTSARVEASHGAKVALKVVERLQAIASQSTITYDGEPLILRTNTSFGGAVEPVVVETPKDSEHK